jgi:hypothetical protein
MAGTSHDKPRPDKSDRFWRYVIVGSPVSASAA